MGFLQRHGKAVASIEASVSQFGGTGLKRIGPPSWSYFACSKCGRRAKTLWLVDEARTGHLRIEFQTDRSRGTALQSIRGRYAAQNADRTGSTCPTIITNSQWTMLAHTCSYVARS